MKAFLVLGVLIAFADSCQACDCIEPSAQENLARATLVFEGVVTHAGTLGVRPMGATFTVTRWLKATKQNRLSITLAAVSTDCDLQFRVGDKWLIFATGKPLKASQCSGSRPIEPSAREHP